MCFPVVLRLKGFHNRLCKFNRGKISVYHFKFYVRFQVSGGVNGSCKTKQFVTNPTSASSITASNTPWRSTISSIALSPVPFDEKLTT